MPQQKELKVLAFSVGLVSAVCASPATEMQQVGNLSIDRTEVTMEAFATYVEATGVVTSAEQVGGGLVYEAGWQRKPGWNWQTPFGGKTDMQLPVVHITFDEAAAYCHWAGKRLPTDLEWHTAAYTESRVSPEPPFITGQTYQYPTGTTPEGANCLGDCGKTSALDYSAVLHRGIGPAPVATSAMGVNGLFDMGANVWEWTDIENDTSKGTRGGSWWYGAAPMASDHRAIKSRDLAAVYIGFRCARGADDK